MAPKYEMAIGLHRGHKVTKNPKKVRPSSNKGRLSKSARLARMIVREITGYAPYERRCMEFIKVSRDKRALKFIKRRLGTHKRGKRKREEMNDLVMKMKTKEQ